MIGLAGVTPRASRDSRVAPAARDLVVAVEPDADACLRPPYELRRLPITALIAPSVPATRTLAIDLVLLPGSTRDALADIAFANEVFAPAWVRLTVASLVRVPEAVAAGWYDGDATLSIGQCADASEEDLRLVVGATETYGLASAIRVFYVAATMEPRRATCCPAYCEIGSAAPLINVVVITNGAAPRSLAHEIGHVLLNSSAHELDATNLMHPTNTAIDLQLTAAQRAAIYAAAR